MCIPNTRQRAPANATPRFVIFWTCSTTARYRCFIAAGNGTIRWCRRSAVAKIAFSITYFRVPAEIEQFVGEWQVVQDGGQVNIGGDDLDGRLGASVLGNAVFDPMAMVQLRLGPLTRAQFDAFLPSGRDHETLRQLSRFYADEQVTVSVQLVLKREEIPGAQLSTPGAPVLGFGTWISAKAPVRDADDVHFKLS